MFNVYWENWEGNGSFGQGDYMNKYEKQMD